jgi:AAA family ATP:ADP antiporter
MAWFSTIEERVAGISRPVVTRLSTARDDEVAPLLWATSYGFCILFSYYILRSVRDEISAADRGNLQILWTVVFLAMLVAVPAYAWAASRFPRRVLVPLANRFFIANLVAFYLAFLSFPTGARVWIDRVFYVWDSVFALFAVTVFWGFMADLFNNEQGKRLFGFIAVGSSVGGIAGSALTSSLVRVLPPFTLLLAACVPLEGASWCVAALHRRFGGGPDASRAENRPLGGSAWSGVRVVFRSPYLLAIASVIVLMTYASGVLYYLQADVIGVAMTDRAARTALFARMDLWANVLTIVLQSYVAARLIRWIGVGASLAVLPIAAGLGFVWLATAPVLTVLVVLQVAYRGLRLGLAKPTREVLFTVVSREEKYKSKPFLDAAIYRGGDLVTGWIYAGLAAVGLSIGAIALTAVPVAAVWTALSLRLGRRQEERAQGLAEERLAQPITA